MNDQHLESNSVSCGGKPGLIIAVITLLLVVLIGAMLVFVYFDQQELRSQVIENQKEVDIKIEALSDEVDVSLIETEEIAVGADSMEVVVPDVLPEESVVSLLTCEDGFYCRKGLCVDENKPNEFGCHSSMTCDAGEVCRSGLCVKDDVAIDQFGCHPAMTCDAGEVCRSGLCVKEEVAINQYGCHPAMGCDAGQVCRSGLCVSEESACSL